MTESRCLEDLLPDPADRAFIEGVYRDLGQEWAAEILGGMLDGTFVEWERVEMGYIDHRPELEGIKRARCTCGGLVDRHGYCSLCKRFCGVPEYEQALNPRQMVLGQKSQLKMEV
jgi:hypothetical protein